MWNEKGKRDEREKREKGTPPNRRLDFDSGFCCLWIPGHRISSEFLFFSCQTAIQNDKGFIMANRFSNYYSAMILDIEDAQRIADSLSKSFNLPKASIQYCQHLFDEANGRYIPNRNQILIKKDNAKLSTLLHEIGHHLEFNAYERDWNEHGYSFQKAIRRVINRFRKLYDDPNFIYISGRMILEPRRK